ncbi:MAG: hypothetical protein JWR80_8604 [Bradyrhizobium sp.]|nr:hypothetical protein [Bradyrhizobium sp.]
MADEVSVWWGRMHGPDAARHRAAFEQWLAADPRHRDAYARLEEGWEITDEAGRSEIFQDRSLERHRPRYGLTLPRVATFAAAAAAIVLAVIFWPGARSPAPQSPQVAQLLHTTVGQVRTLDLPDGSKVTLDTDSQVRVLFGAEARRIELVRGRARFEVRADPARAFVVVAGDMSVNAPEGAFDAALQSQGVQMSAWRGTLDVRRARNGLSAAVLFRLLPGRTAFFRPELGTPPATPVAGKGSEQWVSGMLVYQSVPLSDVLADTNRYSRQHIVLGDASLGKLRVTGTFRPLPVDALAASLSAAFGLRSRANSSGDLVLERP